MWKKTFQTTLTLSIVLVFIVIIAGAVVRMTGSGMGCPDWPKCFGYVIPPTESSQLEWKPNHNYKQGQAIIKDEVLYTVKKNFISLTAYEAKNWESYTKHNYAIFNPVHTWIEYLNRLATVLFGIPLLILFILSLWKINEDKRIFILCLALLVSVLFESILGKIVVDTNLQPVKITLHVLFVFFIVAFLLWLRFIFKKHKSFINRDVLVNRLGIIAVIVTLIQVILGTQLRQYIDVQMQLNTYTNQKVWLTTPPVIFYIHRSFSIFLVTINLFWIWLHKKESGELKLLNWVLLFLVLEVLSGIVLYYLDFPFLSQPIHLLLSSLLFSAQFYSVLRLLKR